MAGADVVGAAAVADRDVEEAVGPKATVPPLWLNCGLSICSRMRSEAASATFAFADTWNSEIVDVQSNPAGALARSGAL